MDICRALNGAYRKGRARAAVVELRESYASKVVARNCWVNKFLIAEPSFAPCAAAAADRPRPRCLAAAGTR